MQKNISIVMAQQNFWVGDITRNVEKIIKSAITARDELQGDVIVFPELALCGYPPEDLLLRPDFHKQIAQALHQLQQAVSGIDMVVGHPQRDVEGKIYNAASVICDNNIIACYHKQCLPNYGVFDEKRYFQTGKTPTIFTVKEISIGIIICEDLWQSAPAAQAVQAGAKILVCLNASPFAMNKSDERVSVLHTRIAENHVPIIYVHGVGGQDELVFDGGSMAIDGDGEIKVQADFYVEKLISVEIEAAEKIKINSAPLPKKISSEEQIYKALVLSVRDYIEKNNFSGVLIGLSGGIDSALTLAIAVDALGKDRVHAVSLPSRFTSALSVKLATEMAKKLSVKLSTISIEPSFQAFLADLKEEFADLPVDKTEENIQARCRGVIMMALSNKTGKLVLTTGNKSEMAVGYATLYGDMAGGFAVLKDVFKTWVYRLADYRNAISLVIPQAIIDRPPTAELAHNQTDQDTLPPYTDLDQILKMYVEEDCSVTEIIAAGFTAETVYKVIDMVDKSEYKRRQSPIGPRVTTRAFGRERRYPLTSKYKAEMP
jgi:NAD+ synthase (glutamine-hydrolysing)